VLENVLACLRIIERHAELLDAGMDEIDRLAQRGISAVHDGNWRLAEQLFADIRQRTADQRHRTLRIRDRAGAARVALVGARVGEYGEE
jgi:hypothetical protein